MIFTDYFDFNKPLSLYVHIPFCTSKCSYCAFYSKPSDCATKRAYADKLVSEIETVVSLMDRPFYTAYIGGGNPGCLEIEDLERIAGAICKNGRPEEFTVEMNPESLEKEYYFLFDKYFTRLSMGVQSFDSKALEFLGRNADSGRTGYGVNLALELRKQTGCQLNLDLITCLGEFHNHIEDARIMAQTIKPDHISLYALTLEEGTALFKKKPVLPDSDRQYEILTELWNYLEDQGYHHYEVSNFSLDNRESKHNKVYWNYRQYLGLGSGASSTAQKDGKYTRITGTQELENYIKTDLFTTYLAEILGPNEVLEEFVIMGMRHSEGLDLTRLEREFGKTVKTVPQGYSVVGNHLVPSDEGLMTADNASLSVDSGF